MRSKRLTAGAAALRCAPEANEEQFVAAALSELRDSPVIASARGMAQVMAQEALDIIIQIQREFPTGARYAAGLQSLVEYCLQRLH